jgi:DNA-binding CsgD family transcriptional regulator
VSGRVAREVEQLVACNCLEQALDLFQVGVVLVDPDGDIMHVNGAAADIVRRHDGLDIHRNQLIPLPPGEGTRLSDMIRLRRSGGVLVTRSNGKQPYQLWVATPHSTHERQTSCVGALILIFDTERNSDGAGKLLRTFYELTPAEARLAELLMNGVSLAQAARHLGVRAETARTHLKKIFAKTHTQRQSELVHLLVQSAAALRLSSA